MVIVALYTVLVFSVGWYAHAWYAKQHPAAIWLNEEMKRGWVIPMHAINQCPAGYRYVYQLGHDDLCIPITTATPGDPTQPVRSRRRVKHEKKETNGLERYQALKDDKGRYGHAQ